LRRRRSSRASITDERARPPWRRWPGSDTFDFAAIPSLNKPLVLELARCQYVLARDNVIALGNSGTGKTHACLALGLAACQRGDHAPFAIDEFEFGEAQKIAGMIEPFAGGLGGDFVIFAQEGRELELAQMMREQDLGRRRVGGRSGGRHAALPGTRTA
jgi:hypothetical protein